MNIFISTKEGATESLVTSEVNLANATLPKLYVGDNLDLFITFLDGEGGYSDFVGRSDILVNAGIGIASSRLLYSRTNALKFNNSDKTYHALFDLGKELLKNAIADNESITLDFEVQLSRYENSYTETLLQTKLELGNQIIEDNKFANVVSEVVSIIL